MAFKPAELRAALKRRVLFEAWLSSIWVHAPWGRPLIAKAVVKQWESGYLQYIYPRGLGFMVSNKFLGRYMIGNLFSSGPLCASVRGVAYNIMERPAPAAPGVLPAAPAAPAAPAVPPAPLGNLSPFLVGSGVAPAQQDVDDDGDEKSEERVVCLEISKAFIDVPAFNKHLPEQMELLSKAVSKHLTVFLTILDLWTKEFVQVREMRRAEFRPHARLLSHSSLKRRVMTELQMSSSYCEPPHALGSQEASRILRRNTHSAEENGEAVYGLLAAEQRGAGAGVSTRRGVVYTDNLLNNIMSCAEKRGNKAGTGMGPLLRRVVTQLFPTYADWVNDVPPAPAAGQAPPDDVGVPGNLQGQGDPRAERGIPMRQLLSALSDAPEDAEEESLYDGMSLSLLLQAHRGQFKTAIKNMLQV